MIAGVATVRSAMREHIAGRFAPAEQQYREILLREPENFEAIHLLGMVLLQQSDIVAALPLLEKAAQGAPGEVDYHNRHGAALAAAGRSDEAIDAYQRGITCRPGHPEIHNNLANLLAARRDHTGAIESYRAALDAKPGFASAHNGLAVVLVACEHYGEAETHYRRALDIKPDYMEARVNLGDLMAQIGRFDEAVADLRVVLDAEPGNLEAMICLADTLARMGNIDEALAVAKAAVDHYPDQARAHNCHGMACRQAGDLQAASAHLARAVALDPNLADAYGNRALTMLALGQVKEAAAAAERAVALEPENGAHRMNLGMIHLLDGDFEHGFEGYRARFDSRQSWVKQRSFAQPVWNGEALDGRRVLVWGEQGVGEEIMFGSLLRQLGERAAYCDVECDPRLVPLFRRSFPDLDAHGRADPPTRSLFGPAIDFTLAMGDLGAALGVCDFAPANAYLVADETATVAARQRLASFGDGLRVGIAWRSRGGNAAFNADKSTDLSDWYPVLGVSGACFIDLQYGDTGKDVARVDHDIGVSITADDTIDQMRNLDGFAALIAALDLVITTSNTTAHLAGALGKEVWVLVPHVPDWRWQLARDDSIWYPRARIIRQPAPGDWRGALVEAGAALAERAGS
jgi:Flp pilus assembly protein TadD